MDRAGAIDFLKGKGYSRRLSAKLVDIAMLEKSDSVFQQALKQALEMRKACSKKKPKGKFVIRKGQQRLPKSENKNVERST